MAAKFQVPAKSVRITVEMKTFSADVPTGHYEAFRLECVAPEHVESVLAAFKAFPSADFISLDYLDSAGRNTVYCHWTRALYREGDGTGKVRIHRGKWRLHSGG